MAARTDNIRVSFGRKPGPHRAFKAAKAPHGEGAVFMDWFKQAIGLQDCEKAAKLRAMLKIDTAEAFQSRVFALLAQIESEDGRTHKTPQELELRVGWKGKKNKLANAMIECRFWTLAVDGTVVVPSWEEWNGAAIRKSKRDRSRAEIAR